MVAKAPKKEVEKDEVEQKNGIDVVSSIQNDLEKDSKSDVQPKGGVNAKTPNMVDLNNLSMEALQALKSALNSVPERKIKKVETKEVYMRFIGDKPIVKIGNCYTGIVRDLQTRSDKEMEMIDVTLHEEKESTQMKWDDFMKLKRVKCPVISERNEEEEIPGEIVYSEMVGHELELTKIVKAYWYTIQFPDGSKVELEDKYLNM